MHIVSQYKLFHHLPVIPKRYSHKSQICERLPGKQINVKVTQLRRQYVKSQTENSRLISLATFITGLPDVGFLCALFALTSAKDTSRTSSCLYARLSRLSAEEVELLSAGGLTNYSFKHVITQMWMNEFL
jgi:hypothetical protein